MARGRGMMGAGLLGLAMGIMIGNTMRRGTVTRQVRSTSKTLMRKARGTVGDRINSWLD